MKKALTKEQKFINLENKKKDSIKNAIKLIDLSYKTLILLDTLRAESLFAGIMPLLSHDKYEIHMNIQILNNGIKTKSQYLKRMSKVKYLLKPSITECTTK